MLAAIERAAGFVARQTSDVALSEHVTIDVLGLSVERQFGIIGEAPAGSCHQTRRSPLAPRLAPSYRFPT